MRGTAEARIPLLKKHREDTTGRGARARRQMRGNAAGANTRLKDESGRTPLDYARRNKALKGSVSSFRRGGNLPVGRRTSPTARIPHRGATTPAGGAGETCK